MNVPINRWTILAILAVAAWVGGDLGAAIARAVSAMVMPYAPAV